VKCSLRVLHHTTPAPAAPPRLVRAGEKNAQWIANVVLLAAATWWAGTACAADDQGDKSLAQQIFETMIQLPGNNPHYRVAHAKGVVCEGTFTPSKDAATLSKAGHFQGGTSSVIVRFSDASENPLIPDNAGVPRGMAVRFKIPGGVTDIVLLSHNGFIVGTGEDFLALQKAAVATDPSKPHPWPIEAFLAAHPLALKFVQETQAVPASFGTQAFFSNDAFIFVNQQGVKQAGRYKLLPAAGLEDLSEAEAKAKSPNFLVEELKTRLSKGPIQYRMIVQLPNAGDPTRDPSLVWPEDRRTVDVGVVSVTSVVPDSDDVQKTLVFFPTNLTDGIELSDDPFPALRTSVYALSFARRQQP
jgi:catalase